MLCAAAVAIYTNNFKVSFFGLLGETINMAAQVASGALLRFAPFTSTIDSGFWHRFTTLKLEELKLSEDPVPLLGHYSNGACGALLCCPCFTPVLLLVDCTNVGTLPAGDQPGLPTRLSVEFSAFQK